MAIDSVIYPNKETVLSINVTFSQGHTGSSEALGWVTIHLDAGLQQDTLRASDAFPPFDDLVSFLVQVAFGLLPTDFQLDEEGVIKEWFASPLDDPTHFRFSLTRDKWLDGPGAAVLIEGIFERRQFVREFHRKLSDYLVTGHRPDLWRFEPLIPQGLERLEAALAQLDAE